MFGIKDELECVISLCFQDIPPKYYLSVLDYTLYEAYNGTHSGAYLPV